MTKKVFLLAMSFFVVFHSIAMEQQPVAVSEEDAFDPCSDEDLLNLVVPTTEKRDLIYEKNRGWRKKLFPRFLREEWGIDRVKVFPGVEGRRSPSYNAFIKEFVRQGFAARLEPMVTVKGNISICSIKLYEKRFSAFLIIQHDNPASFRVRFKPELAQNKKDVCCLAKEGFWDEAFMRYLSLEEFDERALKEEFFSELQQVKELLLRIYATVRDSLPEQ